MRKLLLLPLLALTGCTTQFIGEAQVTRPYCEDYCKKNQLEFTGMVALGEYSSGCICTKKSEKPQQGAAAAGAAAAGVMTAMKARQNMMVTNAIMMQ